MKQRFLFARVARVAGDDGSGKKKKSYADLHGFFFSLLCFLFGVENGVGDNYLIRFWVSMDKLINECVEKKELAQERRDLSPSYMRAPLN